MRRLGKELMNVAVVSLDEGRMLGRIEDLYLNPELDAVAGLYMGSQGLIKRKALLIPRDAIAVLGVDAVLVRDSEAISDDQAVPAAKTWVRRDKLSGREISTPGGTKLGVVGDVVVETDGTISAFALSRVHVEGPLAESRLIDRRAVLDTGQESGHMTADLSALESVATDDTAADKTPAPGTTIEATSASPILGEPLQIEIKDEPSSPTG